MVADNEVKDLGAKRPRSLLEKAFGIAGGMAATAWIFALFLRVIDTISRVQTVLALEPYVHYLVTWWTQLIELAMAVTLIVVATRIEQTRETEDAPRIILLGTREPTPIKRHWLWMKVAGAGTLIAAFAAVGVFLIVGYSRQTSEHASGAIAQSRSVPVTRTSAAPTRNSTSAGVVKAHSASPPKKSVVTRAVQVKSISQPPAILVPANPGPPKVVSRKSSVKYVAQIGGQVVDIKDKAPGTFTVSLAATSNSQYLGNITSADVNNVAEALKKTGKISVFLNRSAGSYNISGNGLGYSLSITQIHPRTIYFFDNRLESACSALRTIVSSIVGKMDCTFVSVQPSKDPSQPNIQHDFLMESGLDMEIDL